MVRIYIQSHLTNIMEVRWKNSSRCMAAMKKIELLINKLAVRFQF
jgi:hypothetical protein